MPPSPPSPSSPTATLDAAVPRLPEGRRAHRGSSRPGTAFLLMDAIHVLTIQGAVGDAPSIAIVFPDGRRVEGKRILPPADERRATFVALFEVPRQPARGFQLSDAGSAVAGDPIAVFAVTKGASSASVTRGIVSAAPIKLPDIDLKLLQIDAAIPVGGAGAPVVDRYGRVIGVVAGQLSGVEAMGYAVPANHAARLGIPDLCPDLSTAWQSKDDQDRRLGKAHILGVVSSPGGPRLFGAVADMRDRPLHMEVDVEIEIHAPSGDQRKHCRHEAHVSFADYDRAANAAFDAGFTSSGDVPFFVVDVSCPEISEDTKLWGVKMRAGAAGERTKIASWGLSY
ncbi:MAG: serine protease [Acidobacteriota bacterium]